MKKLLLLALVAVAPILTHAQNFAWASLIASTGNDLGMAIAHDDSGNVYSAGYFSSTADFDPGAGVYNLSSLSGTAVYILKQNPSGVLMWAKCITKLPTTSAAASATTATIAVDAMGSVYIGGSYSGTVDFDPGSGTASATAVTGSDAFVLKLDRNGNYVYHKLIGGSAYEVVAALTVDRSNNVVMTGRFSGTADFDPGTGVVNLTSVGSDDIFVEKLTGAGNMVWVKQFGGSALDNGYAIATDDAGSIYSTGIFCGTADMDPGAGTFSLNTSPSFRECYVSKLDSNGNFIWAVQMGSYVHEDIGYGIAVDALHNVFITGSWEGTADFDPSAAGYYPIASNGGSYDMFIEKLDSAGNFVWAKQVGGTASDGGYAMVLDTFSNIYITGSFTGTVDFDPGTATNNLTSVSTTQYDAFVLKLDTVGNYIWAGAIGGRGSDVGHGICIDGLGSIYTAGSCQDTVDFDPSSAVYNLPGSYGTDIYVHKLTQCLPGNPTINIISHPGDTLVLANSDTFSAIITRGGTTPAYQWYLNGVAVTGATSATWVCDTLAYGDVVSCQLTSNDSCVTTNTVTSSGHTIIILDVAVAAVATGHHLSVYPNPTNGTFICEARGVTGSSASCLLTDVTGRVITSCIVAIKNGSMHTAMQIPENAPDGIYLLQLNSEAGKEIVRLVLQR